MKKLDQEKRTEEKKSSSTNGDVPRNYFLRARIRLIIERMMIAASEHKKT